MPSRRRLIFVSACLLLLRSTAAADETVLFERQSTFNTVVVTENTRGLRTLWFQRDGARQSVVRPGDPDHIELPYARAMPVALALVERPERVLIVGLGGATIPNFLHKHFPEMTIDVVEIDPVVVEAATRFFGFRQDATMHAYVEDGRALIERSGGRYDIIFLDAFGADNVPFRLATREFLQSVRQALTPRGIVAGNIWSRSSNRLHDSMVQTYLDVFEQLYVLEVRGAGNEILLAVPHEQAIARDALERRARNISRTNGFRFDMGDCVRFSFRVAGNETFGGHVLTDAEE